MNDTLVATGKILAGTGAATLAMPPIPSHTSIIVQGVTYALPFVMSFLSHLILHLITKKSNDSNNQTLNN